jgi:sigma-B regulation protein RsbU (phosphoserine phosphatase)
MLMPASWTHQSFDLEELEIAEFTRPFHTVGGDLLEIRSLGHGRWDVLVLDVAGKGIPAYRAARQLRQAFRDFGPARPGEILSHLNMVMKDLAEDLTSFATALLIHLDLPAGKAKVADAGHTPLLRRRENGVTEQLKLQLHQPGRPTDIPLGLMPETAYPERTLRVSPGDTFVLFTDGLSEARDPQGKLLGSQGLLETLSQNGSAAPKALLESLILRAQGDGNGFGDDATCAVLRIPRLHSEGAYTGKIAA